MSQDLTTHDLGALREFREKYPTWWYSIGVCDVSRDFTAAPQGHSPEAKHIRVWQDELGVHRNEFDTGFMCDHPGSLADAIYAVMEDIKNATEAA